MLRASGESFKGGSMKKLAGLAVAAALLAPAATAQNKSLDFTLVNKTGVEIHSVYIAPNESDDWGDDVMGKDTLGDGESVDIEFHPKAKAAKWDLRVEDEDGNSVEWESLDLTKISELTLKIVKGKPTAEWK